MKKVIFAIVLLLPMLILAQAKEKQNPRLTFRGVFGIPRTLSSKMFRTTFNGVVETGLSVNYKLAGNLFVGGGYQYSLFALRKEPWLASSDPKFGNTYYQTKLIGQGGFIKIGFDKYFSEIGYMSYALNTGLMTYVYADRVKQADTYPENQPKAGTSFNTPYIQPELGFNFLAEEKVSISLLLSYTATFYTFNPKSAGLNHISEIRRERNSKSMGWINIGLGINILLGK